MSLWSEQTTSIQVHSSSQKHNKFFVWTTYSKAWWRNVPIQKRMEWHRWFRVRALQGHSSTLLWNPPRSTYQRYFCKCLSLVITWDKYLCNLQWAIYVDFLKWWYPQNTPKWSFLVGKPWLLGTTILGNPHIPGVEIWTQQRNNNDTYKIHWICCPKWQQHLMVPATGQCSLPFLGTRLQPCTYSQIGANMCQPKQLFGVKTSRCHFFRECYGHFCWNFMVFKANPPKKANWIHPKKTWPTKAIPTGPAMNWITK